MIQLDDLKRAAAWATKGVTLNRVVLILILALVFDVIFSDTYTSKQNYIQIYKQVEKLQKDREDFKYSDIEGLYGICRDLRFIISKELTRSEADKMKLDRGCRLISRIYEKIPLYDFEDIINVKGFQNK